MHLSNNLQITTNPIKTIQCRRIFNLIQQNTNTPTRLLTQINMQQFLKLITLQSQTKSNQLCEVIGHQLTMQRFVNSLVALTSDTHLTNQSSLITYYQHIKSILLSDRIKQLQLFELWEHQQILSSSENVQKIKLNIDQFLSRLLPYLDGMETYTFQNSLQQINYCLSAITLPHIREDEVLNIYKPLVNPTLLNHVSQFLNSIVQFVKEVNIQNQLLQQSQNIINYINLICYLYTACSLKTIRERLQSQSCLFYTQTYSIIISLLKIPQVRIKKQSAICLALMTKYNNKFVSWLISDVNIENNILLEMINIFNTLGDNQGLHQTIICLRHLIRQVNDSKLGVINNSNNLINNNNSNLLQISQQKLTNITTPILEFTLKTLRSVQIMQTQQQCLYLISQIIKTHPITYPQLQEIKSITKVFITLPNAQTMLIPPTLLILQSSIIYNKNELTQITIHDHGFLTCLQQNVANKQSPYYYQLQNILYLLSQKQPKFVVEKANLLQQVISMLINDSNPAVISLGTDILLNIINYAVENQHTLELLYDKYGLFDKLIPVLFKKCFNKNNFILQFISPSQQNSVNYNYFDKSMLMIIFQILYVLAVAISRKHKRLSFSKKLNQQIIRAMTNIINDIFMSNNTALMELILRQKIIISCKKLKSQTGIAFYKLVNILFEQMTYGMDHRPIQFLRMINQQKKNYSKQLVLSKFFSLHELQVDNIPIYLDIQITFQSNPITRSIPHKFQLTSVKCYIKQFVSKLTQLKQQQIKDIVLKHVDTTRIIQNQVQYRSIANKSIENKLLLIKFQVIDVKLKPRRDQMASMSYINLSGEGLSRSTVRDNRQNSFVGKQLSRGTSIIGQSAVNRFTPLREQPSQFNEQRRSYFSPINFNYSSYRGKSPAFGGSGENRNK